MKANRKSLLMDESGVSPVIAVILMVAITVVLAATVFVLVNDVGSDVGQTGPALGLNTNGAGTDNDKWTVMISSASSAVRISEYTFILTIDGFTDSSPWLTGDDTPGSGTEDGAYFTINEECYWLEHADLQDDGDLRVGDRLVLTKDADDECDDLTDNDGFGDDLSDRHTLEFIHRQSESGAGSISYSF